LRKIIERIADEDCFDLCLFTPKLNQRFMPRERCTTVNAAKKPRFVDYRVSARTTTEVEETTGCFEETSETTADAEGDSEAGKGGITGNSAYCNSDCSSSDCYQRPDLLRQCLLYWQEHLPSPKKIIHHQ
jgi:uncharacterized protein (DUF2126 family)